MLKHQLNITKMTKSKQEVTEHTIKPKTQSPGCVSVYSFFSCSGFLDLGFELADKQPYIIRMANEINEDFRKCYRFARENLKKPIPVDDDFIFSNSIEDFVLWGGKPRKGCEATYKKLDALLKADRDAKRIIGFIGGPPCPDFSVAGLNAGKNGNVGPLSSKYVRLINQEEPHFFLFENVKGLLASGKHQTYFRSLCKKLSEKYFISYQLVNALWYGVPQYRERLIIVGVRRDLLSGFSHRKLGQQLKWESFQLFKKAVMDNRTKWPSSRPYTPDPNLPPPQTDCGIAELTVYNWWKKNNVVHHLNQINQTRPKAYTRHRYESIYEGNSKGKSYHRLHRWKYAFTACYGHNEVPLHPWEPRRISVAEALATQSLPEDFKLPPTMKISALFKAVGNGVPFLMAKGLANMINSFLTNNVYEAAQ